jgi:hypothetical protein
LRSGFGLKVDLAALVDGSSLDLLSHVDDALATSEVNVGRREVVEALVVAAVIVVIDEVGDGTLQLTRQV